MSNATQDQPGRKTTYDLGTERLTMVEWEDPADLPKTRTTYDAQKQNLMVDYEDPDDLPKRKTTYDTAMEALTVEYPPVEIGTLQVMDGKIYRFSGSEWVTT